MKRGRGFMVSVAMLVALASPDVCADPVDFTITGTGSGSLGGAAFNDRDFVVMISGDTDDIDTSIPDTPFIEGLSGTITLDGFGASTFTESLYVFSYQPGETVGFGNDVQFDLIDLFEMGVGIDTYDMTTSFGPIFSASPFFSQFQNVATSSGSLTFTSMSDATFEANVIPEPSTFALCVLGLGFAVWRRRRRKNAA